MGAFSLIVVINLLNRYLLFNIIMNCDLLIVLILTTTCSGMPIYNYNLNTGRNSYNPSSYGSFPNSNWYRYPYGSSIYGSQNGRFSKNWGSLGHRTTRPYDIPLSGLPPRSS